MVPHVLVVWKMVRIMVVFGANVVRLGCKFMFLVDLLPPMVAHVLVSPGLGVSHCTDQVSEYFILRTLCSSSLWPSL